MFPGTHRFFTSLPDDLVRIGRDTETVAVMAIQRADGASSRAEAQRLAGLIAASRRP